MENISSEEIIEVYKYFPNSENLIGKMEKFLFGDKPKIEDRNTKKRELEKLIKLDFDERKPILQKIDIFSNFIISPDFIFTPNLNLVSKFVLDDIWSQSFHDFMRKQKIIADKKIYELYSALYGITFDFDYQLYLFEPLLDVNYTAEHLFLFRQLGGKYAITKNGVYYSFIVGQEKSEG